MQNLVEAFTHRRVTTSRPHLHNQVELNYTVIRILLRSGAPTYFPYSNLIKREMIQKSCRLLGRERRSVAALSQSVTLSRVRSSRTVLSSPTMGQTVIH